MDDLLLSGCELIKSVSGLTDPYWIELFRLWPLLLASFVMSMLLWRFGEVHLWLASFKPFSSVLSRGSNMVVSKNRNWTLFGLFLYKISFFTVTWVWGLVNKTKNDVTSPYESSLGTELNVAQRVDGHFYMLEMSLLVRGMLYKNVYKMEPELTSPRCWKTHMDFDTEGKQLLELERKFN